MTEDQRNRPGVNLEELERQLRVASRAHAEAAIRDNSQPIYSEKAPIVPDLEALRREFARQHAPTPPQPNDYTDDLPDPGPPPAFLSAPASFQNQQEYPNPFDERFPLIDRNKDRGSPLFRILVLVVIVLFSGAVGYFLYSGKLSLSVSVAPDQKSVPVIKADTNPVKIVPEVNPANDAAPVGSELFGKKGADTVISATTKSTTEAPVDVNAAVKNAGNKVATLVPGMGEPKAVRTVTIRPDGTPIGEPASGIASANATPVIATPSATAMAQEATQVNAAPAVPTMALPLNLANKQPLAAPVPDPSTALPVLPTTIATINGGPVPLPMPRPVELDTVAGNDDPLSALVAQATVEPETKATDSVPVQNEAVMAGEYAVQFGASPSEAEANTLSTRIKSQLADLLDGHSVAVIKADSNGKTVFRVRALGYSRDEAAAACATAAASGSKCFIAKN